VPFFNNTTIEVVDWHPQVLLSQISEPKQLQVLALDGFIALAYIKLSQVMHFMFAPDPTTTWLSVAQTHPTLLTHLNWVSLMQLQVVEFIRDAARIEILHVTHL